MPCNIYDVFAESSDLLRFEAIRNEEPIKDVYEPLPDSRDILYSRVFVLSAVLPAPEKTAFLDNPFISYLCCFKYQLLQFFSRFELSPSVFIQKADRTVRVG